jgi:hypothetical protein
MANPYFIRIANPEGTDQNNEAVACTRSETFNSTTYYIGQPVAYTDSGIFENGSTYGVWTAASKGGSQLTAVSRLPSGPTEIGIDLPSATLISTTSRTVYTYYRGYGRVKRDDEILGDMQFMLPGLLDHADASAKTVFRMKTLSAVAFSGATVANIDNLLASLTFTITTDVGESGNSDTVTISSGQNEGTSTFSSNLTYAAGETIRVTVPANTAGANNVAVLLRKG